MRPQSILKVVLVCVLAVAIGAWTLIRRSSEAGAHVALTLPAVESVDTSRGDAELAKNTDSTTTRTTPDAPGIHGRVIDTTTLAPLAGWTVRLRSPRPIEARAERILTMDRGDGVMHRVRVSFEGALPVAEKPAVDQRREDNPLAIEVPNLEGERGGFTITFDESTHDAARAAIEQALERQRLKTDAPPAPPDSSTAQNSISDRRVEEFASILSSRLEQAQSAPHLVANDGSEGPPLSAERFVHWPTITNESDDDVLEVVTDADGRFDFACPNSDRARLQLVAQAPQFPIPAERALESAVVACSQFIEWRVELVRRELFRGRVVDDSRVVGIANLSVALRSRDGTNDACTTDAEGRFVSTKHFARGEIVVAFHDGPESLPVACTSGSVNFLAHDESAAEVTLQAAIGPMFRFEPRIARAFIYGDLSLRFVNLKPASLEAGESNPLADWLWAALRRDDVVSFRCPSPVVREHEGPVYAEMMASEGLLFARVELASITDPERNPLPMSFSLRAVVRGKVTQSGDPVVGVTVSALDANGFAQATTTTRKDGGYFLPALDASRVVSVEVRALNARTNSPVSLHAGDTCALDVALPGIDLRGR